MGPRAGALPRMLARKSCPVGTTTSGTAAGTAARLSMPASNAAGCRIPLSGGTINGLRMGSLSKSSTGTQHRQPLKEIRATTQGAQAGLAGATAKRKRAAALDIPDRPSRALKQESSKGASDGPDDDFA